MRVEGVRVRRARRAGRGRALFLKWLLPMRKPGVQCSAPRSEPQHRSSAPSSDSLHSAASISASSERFFPARVSCASSAPSMFGGAEVVGAVTARKRPLKARGRRREGVCAGLHALAHADAAVIRRLAATR